MITGCAIHHCVSWWDTMLDICCTLKHRCVFRATCQFVPNSKQYLASESVFVRCGSSYALAVTSLPSASGTYAVLDTGNCYKPFVGQWSRHCDRQHATTGDCCLLIQTTCSLKSKDTLDKSWSQRLALPCACNIRLHKNIMLDLACTHTTWSCVSLQIYASALTKLSMSVVT